MVSKRQLSLVIGILSFAAALGVACGASEGVTGCKDSGPFHLQVSELMVNPGGDGGEWVEVFNSGKVAVETSGLTIFAHTPDGGSARSHLFLWGSIDAGAHFVFGDVGNADPPEWIDGAYHGNIASAAIRSGTMGLRCGDEVVASATWNRPATKARALMRSGGAADEGLADGAFCDAPLEFIYSPPNAGTPGKANPPCPIPLGTDECFERSRVRKMRRPAAGEIWLNEIMADPLATSDAKGEYLEFQAKTALDLNGLAIRIGTRFLEIDSSSCVTIDAGGFFLVAPSGDSSSNGGLPQVDWVGTLGLANSGSQVQLVGPDGGELDRVAYPAAKAGISWQREPWSQQAGKTPAPKWCLTPKDAGSSPDAGDYGTPRRANFVCP